MPELLAVETPRSAGFVDSKYNNANKRRIQEQEAELEELMNNGEEEQQEEEKPSAKASDAPTEEQDESLTGEERTYKKRYSDLRSHQNKQAEELKTLKAQLENAQERGDIRPPKSDEDIEAWSREYPDVSAIVERIAEKKAQEKFAGAESRLQEIDRISAEADRDRMEGEIRAMHPDFDELRASDVFHDWAGEQPKWVQDALYENSDDAASVVRVIDLYKVDNGMTKSDYAAKRKAAAGTVKKASKVEVEADDAAGSFKESDIARMSTQEYEKQEEAITKAIQSGKFIYDLSGNAR